MKSLLRYFSVFMIITNFSMVSGYAQSYKTGIGIRGNTEEGAGIDFKHFVASNQALEGILSFYNHSIKIAGLYEVHGMASSELGLNWFMGGGAHLRVFDNHVYIHNNNRVQLGIDGIIGLEYTFANAPVSISVDWKPEINLITRSGFNGVDFGVSVRYIFK